jgi:hypothetical protein
VRIDAVTEDVATALRRVDRDDLMAGAAAAAPAIRV